MSRESKQKLKVGRIGLAVAMTACLAVSPATALAAPPGGAPGASSSNVSWTGASTISSAGTYANKTYKTTQADTNAVLVKHSSGTVKLTNPTVTKSGGTSASDEYSFYGTNSAVMCKGGGTTTISDATITTNAAGANGVFSYGANNGTTNATGDGTTVNISDSKITTSKQGSGGIMTTYGGTTVAKNLTVTTSGGSSAPIRTDRGGGWVTVTGGTYTSSGLGSPAIYSTADVDVSSATLTSKKSEGTCIEGNGSIELKNCNLTATNNALNGNSRFYNTVMIYQSMSGDATGTGSEFTMTGGKLTSNNGDTFHVTNTNATINLEDVAISNSSEGVLLSVCDDGWSGNSNKATVKASNQVLAGDVLVGSDSTLNLKLSDSSSFGGKTVGSFSNDKGSKVSSSLGTVSVTLGEGCIWMLTGDCSVSSLSGSGKINYNGHTLKVGSKSYSSGSIGDITETTETVATDTSSSSGSTSSVTVKSGVKVNTSTGVATINKKTVARADVKAAVKAGGKKFVLGNKVKTVKARAFKGFKRITKVTVGKNVASIGAQAFKGCTKLKGIVVKSAKLIAKSSVKNCLKGSKVKTVKLKGMKSTKKKAVKNAFKRYSGKSNLTVS